jgi:hypothetical protein
VGLVLQRVIQINQFYGVNIARKCRRTSETSLNVAFLEAFAMNIAVQFLAGIETKPSQGLPANFKVAGKWRIELK